MLPRKLKSRIFDNVSNRPLRYVTPVPFSRAEGLVAEVYDQVADEFFINGAITTHSVRPALLAGMWCAGRELVLTDGALARDTKEALGVTFAQLNGCTYCEDMLISVVHGAQDHELATLMRARAQQEIPEHRTRHLHEWALSCLTPDAPILRKPPFTPVEAPEMLGTALMFNYLNRYTRIFFDGTPLNPPFSSHALKSVMFRGFGVEVRGSVTRRLTPGRATALLPQAALPDDLQWAAPNAHVAEAVARWAGVVDAAAEADIPARAQAAVNSAVQAWGGEDMPLSRGWVDEHVSRLNRSEQAAATVALLTALSPAQMSDDIIAEYRRYHAEDGPLVSTVAWAAFTAARRMTSWVAEAATRHPVAERPRGIEAAVQIT